MGPTSLTLVCPNARRCKIETTPTMLMNAVLTEACLRTGYEVSRCGLLFHGKAVDLSLPYRLSLLPANATLEIVELVGKGEEVAEGGEAEITLQMPDGKRVSCRVAVNTSLKQLLEVGVGPHMGEINLPASSAAPPATSVSVPCVSYLNTQWKGENQLQATTLRAMGIKPRSRVLLRYNVVSMAPEEWQLLNASAEGEARKRTALNERFQERMRENKLREEAWERFDKEVEERRHENEKMEQMEQSEEERKKQQAVEQRPTEAPNRDLPTRLEQLHALYNEVNAALDENRDIHMLEGHLAPVQLIQPDFSDFKFPELPIALDCGASKDHSPPESSLVLKLNSVPKAERNAIYYDSAASNTTSGATIVPEESPDFFEVTEADAKLRQKDLAQEVKRSETTAFLSKKYLAEKNKRLKEESYKNAVVRFTLPDSSIILQAQFHSMEPCARLYEFLNEMVFQSSSPTNYALFLVEKIDATTEKSLLDFGIAPTSTIRVRVKHSQQRAWEEHIFSAAREVTSVEADRISNEWLATNDIFIPYEKRLGSVDGSAINSTNRGAGIAHGAISASSSTASQQLPKWLKLGK